MDGFFLSGRTIDPDFSWSKLVGKKVLVDHGGQPLAMFKYACFKKGIDFTDIGVVDAGTTDEMEDAFRAGEGDYVHAQGPMSATWSLQLVKQLVHVRFQVWLRCVIG